MTETLIAYHTPHDINYSKSTEDNFAKSEVRPLVGKYAFLRKLLDYDYHKHYSEERQHLHDALIDSSSKPVIYDNAQGKVCESPAGGNWIVFTAGAFGAGKSHVLSWLSKRGYFPLHSFVVVDPDHLREKLPETKEYIRRDPLTAGFLTQKEVGYISEVLILKSLLDGKNVIVDGSLRDSEWYSQYMLRLRNTFPFLKLAIIHVTTTLKTALSRASKRGHETGRVVPESAIKEAIRSIPKSLERLCPYVDYSCTFRNEGPNPELIYSSHGDTSLSNFQDVWEMSCPSDKGNEQYECPATLANWKNNDYFRFIFPDFCKLNSAL